MISTALILAALVIGSMGMWRRGARGIAFVCALCAALPAITLAQQLPWPVWIAATCGAVFLIWNRAARSAGIVVRWSSRTRRKAGVASATDIARLASATAMRRRTATLRPSLADLSRWGRWRLPAAEVGVRLCRTAWQGVWCSIEDVLLIFGGPRVGKTGLLAGLVLDAPGAALVTSTRTDLLELCGPLRANNGPVFVFNAVGLGDIASTITFDPLTGCADAVTAMERAIDMLAAVTRAGSGGDREFWDAQARRVLAALLHAAALGHHGMGDVLGWVSDPDSAIQLVPQLLRRSGVAAFEQDALQFLGTNDRTRTSITSTVMPALSWLNHPDAAKAAAPGAGFDVAALLDERATVFLLGAEETQAAPLVCALTGHIAREARRLAATRPGGRLDPPLGLFLDEAALISPVPLESWTADMGGRGVTICAAFQSRAQLLARWGIHNTATILNNTGAVVVFGGTRDRDDLQFWSTLAGERDEPITTTDLHGRVASRTSRRVPVVPPAQIANLPAGRVLVIRRALPPVLGRAQMAWRRADVVAHFHPDALLVRARARSRQARVVAARWVVGHALPLLGALIGLWVGAQLAGALSPVWRAWAATVTAGVIGWLIGALAALGWRPVSRCCRHRILLPARSWIVSVARWLGTSWRDLRVRITGHGGQIPADPPTEPLHVVAALPAPGGAPPRRRGQTG